MQSRSQQGGKPASTPPVLATPSKAPIKTRNTTQQQMEEERSSFERTSQPKMRQRAESRLEEPGPHKKGKAISGSPELEDQGQMDIESEDLFSYFETRKEDILAQTEEIPELPYRRGCKFLARIDFAKNKSKTRLRLLSSNSGEAKPVTERLAVPKSAEEIPDKSEVYQQGDIVVASVVRLPEENKLASSLRGPENLDTSCFRKGQVLLTFVGEKNKGQLALQGTSYKFQLLTPISEMALSQYKQFPTSIVEVDHKQRTVTVEPLSSEQYILKRKYIAENRTNQMAAQCVVPGTLVNAKVLKVVANGLAVGFLGGLVGYIAAGHLLRPLKHYAVEMLSIKARIISSSSSLGRAGGVWLSERLVNLDGQQEKQNESSMLNEERPEEEMLEKSERDQRMEEEHLGEPEQSEEEAEEASAKKALSLDFKKMAKANLEGSPSPGPALYKRDLPSILKSVEQLQSRRLRESVLSVALCCKVIGMISDPDYRELEHSSLSDQILALLEPSQEPTEDKNSQGRKSEKEPKALTAFRSKMHELFRDGVEKREKQLVFNQQRMADSTITDKIVFLPNCVVTSQVFRVILNEGLNKVVITQGQQGIAKSFAYFLYQELSDCVFGQLMGYDKAQIGHIFQFVGQASPIPKLFYWTMNIAMSDNQTKLKEIFRVQAKEAAVEYQFSESFVDYVQRLTDFYEEKGIRVILLVDQINTIASQIRKKLIGIHKKQPIDVNKYQQAMSLNFKRKCLNKIDSIKNFIFNSSVNFETLFRKQHFNSGQNKTLYYKISQELDLTGQIKHSPKIIPQIRVMHPELMNFHATQLSLADCFRFEIGKKKSSTVDRKIVCKLIRRSTENLCLNSYQIRRAVHKKKKEAIQLSQEQLQKQPLLQPQSQESQVQRFIAQAFKITKSQLQKNHKNFMEKMADLKQREKAQATLLLSLVNEDAERQEAEKRVQETKAESVSKEITEEELNLKRQRKVTAQIQKLIGFLGRPIYFQQCSMPLHYLLENLDRNLFVTFHEPEQVTEYFRHLRSIMRGMLVLEFEESQIKMARQIFTKKMAEYSSQIIGQFKQKGNVAAGLCFLPPEITMEILREQVDVLDIVESERCYNNLRDFYSQKNGACFGHFLEDVLIRCLASEKSRINIINAKTSFLNSEAGKEPRLLKYAIPQSNWQEKDRHNQRFLNQFAQQKDDGHYLYKPQMKNHKAVDFVIQKVYILNQKQVYQIYLFDVTCNNTGLNKKIDNFLDAYAALGKKLPNVDFQVYYVLVGTPLNQQQMKGQVRRANERLQQTKGQNPEKYQYLQKIYCENFCKITLITQTRAKKAFETLKRVAKEQFQAKNQTIEESSE